MSEEAKNSGMSGLAAYGVLGATAVGGIYLLATAGLVGTLVLGGLSTAAVAGYSVYKGESPIDAVTSLFKKIGGFYKNAFSAAKKGFGSAAEWAEERQASRTVETGEPAVSKLKTPDFDAAAAKPAAEVKKEAKPAPAPKPQTYGMK